MPKRTAEKDLDIFIQILPACPAIHSTYSQEGAMHFSRQYIHIMSAHEWYFNFHSIRKCVSSLAQKSLLIHSKSFDKAIEVCLT